MNDDWLTVADGAHCVVKMSRNAYKEYNKAPAKDRARAERIMNELAENGPENLNDEQFKSEGRFPSGGRDASKVAVYAVKSYQVRVYGGWVMQEKRMLLCPEAAIKKQNKADQDQLRRVAKKVGENDGAE